MAQARATWPGARVMADGRIRVFDQGTYTVPASGQPYTEFAGPGWETEIIPDPEPRWSEGDVVVDSAGQHFVRTPAGRWQEVLGTDADPVRPLTLMVPGP